MTDVDLEDIIRRDSALLFSQGELRLFEHLDELLAGSLNQQDATRLMGELRDRLLDQPGDPAKARQALATSISACRVCDEVVEDPTNGHWNLTDPQLLLVTSKPLKETPGNGLIVNSLKTAEFSSQRVGAISIVRCAPRGPRPQEEHIDNCTTRYLYRQIQLLQPDLIIGIGALASSLLVGDPQLKVTNHIGEIFWSGPWAIMTTISPGYASHHPAREEAFTQSFIAAHRFLYDKAEDR